MKDISTRDHINRLCICIERRVRADCINRLQPSGPHAASVKARQREESAALKALNRHFRDIERLVKSKLSEPDPRLYGLDPRVKSASFKKAEKRIRKRYKASQKNSGAT